MSLKNRPFLFSTKKNYVSIYLTFVFRDKEGSHGMKSPSKTKPNTGSL